MKSIYNYFIQSHVRLKERINKLSLTRLRVWFYFLCFLLFLIITSFVYNLFSGSLFFQNKFDYRAIFDLTISAIGLSYFLRLIKQVINEKQSKTNL